MVCSDAHVPLHSVLMFKRLVVVARRLGISALAIIGDLIDHHIISKYSKRGGRMITTAESLALALMLLVQLLKYLETIEISQGNHDQRLMKLIGRAAEKRSFEHDMLSEIADADGIRFRTYNEQYIHLLKSYLEKHAPEVKDRVVYHANIALEVEGPDGLPPYRLTHPRIYSRHTPLAEKRLWSKYLQPVGGAHGHGLGLGLSPNAKHPVFQWGSMTDSIWHDYIMENDTDHPIWTMGFAAIDFKGILHLYPDNPYLMDWSDIDNEAAELEEV